jgi:hypothetical protein
MDFLLLFLNGLFWQKQKCWVENEQKCFSLVFMAAFKHVLCWKKSFFKLLDNTTWTLIVNSRNEMYQIYNFYSKESTLVKHNLNPTKSKKLRIVEILRWHQLFMIHKVALKIRTLSVQFIRESIHIHKNGERPSQSKV